MSHTEGLKVEYFSAVNQCRIKKKDLVSADPFKDVFNRMMKWVYSRIRFSCRKALRKGKQRKFYPGKFVHTPKKHYFNNMHM